MERTLVPQKVIFKTEQGKRAERISKVHFSSKREREKTCGRRKIIKKSGIRILWPVNCIPEAKSRYLIFSIRRFILI